MNPEKFVDLIEGLVKQIPMAEKLFLKVWESRPIPFMLF